MECEHIENLLSPYLEGELPAEDRLAVEEHLRSCADCSVLLDLLRQTQESLADFPQAEMSEGLVERLYEIPHRKKKFRLSLDFLVRPALQPYLAAATILLTLVSFYLFHPEKSAIDKSINRNVHLGYSKIGKLYSEAGEFTASLGEHKDNILDTIKSKQPFGRNGD
ncbi:MAG: zf-HC2 domain-containing protein [Candidatus Aminicenantes bacterium]|jgi:predicted anti-sigma-YlaC factor YlaD